MSEATSRTKAAVRRSWWPGWIWAIPIAAVLLVGWWLLRTFMTGGEDITITFDDVHGLKESNTNVVYRGMKVGSVSGMQLAKDGKTVEVTVNIEDSATKFLNAGTRFWLRGATPSLSDPSSFGALLSGPTIMMDPGPGPRTTHFVGSARQPVVSGTQTPPQLYEVSMNGAVGEVAPGQPVKLRGFTVGEVKDIGFRYDPKSGAITTPVTLALYPSLFRLDGASSPDSDAALKAAIERLIGNGLRAELQRDPPLIGSPQVTLAMMPGATKAEPGLVNGLPQIPAAPGGGITSIVDRINRLPIEQIGQNLLQISDQVQRIVASPKLADAIVQLDGTLAQLHQTTSSAGPKIAGLVDSLRRTAGLLDGAVKAAESTAKTAQETARSANAVLGGTSASQNDIQSALREITEAARSVRELANYLDRHPEALIQGRSGG